MATVPAVTLTANMQSILAAAETAGYLRVTLCGFGPVLPLVSGSGMLADAGVPQLKGPQVGGTPISVVLYGNDVITPAGTVYEIAVLDSAENVIQSGLYRFAQLGGANAVDLSTAAQIPQPGQVQPWVQYLTIIWNSAGGVLQLSGVQARMFDITLHANIGTLQLSGFSPGTQVQILVQQDGVGGWNFPWPANVKNPPLVDPAPNSITTVPLTVRADGNLYPPLGWS